jgi:hypothetical protein
MLNFLTRFWYDERGSLIVTEWVFVATILVLGTITGLVAVRQATLTELANAAASAPAYQTTNAPAGS